MKGVGGTPDNEPYYKHHAMMYIVVNRGFTQLNDKIQCLVSVTQDDRIRIVPFSKENIERVGDVAAYQTEMDITKTQWSGEIEVRGLKINEVDQNILNQLRVLPPSEDPLPIENIHQTKLNEIYGNYTCETDRSRYTLKFMTPEKIGRYAKDENIDGIYKDLNNNDQMKQYFKNFQK